MDIFDSVENKSRPLADRMRVDSLEEFIGQEHIASENSLLRRAIQADRLGSCIFYGPTGCGKTTLAHIIASATGGIAVKLNAVSSGVADAKRVIAEARDNRRLYGRNTYLLLDECHRWSKAQSDSVLEAIECGDIIFIGSTTENPNIAMTNAIISRCRVFEFKKLSEANILEGLKNAIGDKEKGLGNYNIKIEDKALEHFAWVSDGDMRVALNALELAVLTTQQLNNVINITLEVAEQSIQYKSLAIDKNKYYDMLSAFCKSLRGSDSDAALYWAERMIAAGIDPMIIARRLIVHSSEDVGMANPNALLLSVAAMNALEKIGLPEGKIPLYQAIIFVSEASKSNSVVVAKYAVELAVKTSKDDNVPMTLVDTSYKNDKTTGYKYPHDFGGYVVQQYLPNSLKCEVFYKPSNNGYEKDLVRAKTTKENKG